MQSIVGTFICIHKDSQRMLVIGATLLVFLKLPRRDEWTRHALGQEERRFTLQGRNVADPLKSYSGAFGTKDLCRRPASPAPVILSIP